MNSVRPISVIGKQRVGQANSVGPIAHFGETETLRKEIESLHCELGGTDRSSCWTETLRRETKSLQSHLGETEIPIGETKVTRVSGSGYVK